MNKRKNIFIGDQVAESPYNRAINNEIIQVLPPPPGDTILETTYNPGIIDDNLPSSADPTFPAGDEKVTDGSDTSDSEPKTNNNNLLMLLGVAFVGFLLFRRK